MAKRGKRTFSKAKISPSERAQTAAAEYATMAGQAMPDHELNTLGISNQARRFDIDDPSNGPSVVFRRVRPFAAFTKGFAKTSISESGGPGHMLDNNEPYDGAMLAITPMAEYWESDVWPVLSTLFDAGVGSRTYLKINECGRYFARVMDCYQTLMIPVTINKLVYHTDWSKVSPFSNVVPDFLYTMAENLEADNIGMAETWLPLMKRLETMILFPNITKEIKRMLTPMMSIDLHGRVMVPIHRDPVTCVVEDIKPIVTGHLTYLQMGDMAKVTNTIASFLPFPFKDQDPWTLPELPLIDVDRDSGWFNSPTSFAYEFGDTGDPTKNKQMMFEQDSNYDWGTTIHYTRHVQPIWSEIKLASIFGLNYSASDDTFRLLTPHHISYGYIVDDAFDVITYDGSSISNADPEFPYIDYVNCRFASTDLNYGIQKPGTFGAELTYQSILRMMRLETSYLFNVDILKNVAQHMAGSSLREIRWTIRDILLQNLKGNQYI